jgi:tetratricopeptide (TPR) repeat protein
MWEVDGGRELWKADGIYPGVSFSADGRRLAASGPQGFRGPQGLRVWEVDGRELWKADGDYLGVSFSPDGRRVAGSGSQGLRVWEADGGRELWKTGGLYRSMSFTADGRRLAACGFQGVRVWETDGGRELWKTDGVYYSVSFSPDRSLLAVGGQSALRLFGGPPELSRLQEFRRHGIDATRMSGHEQRATESENGGNWFAAEFHRRWLIRIQPSSGTVHYQYGLLLTQLRRHEEAKKELAAALDLKTSLPPLTAGDCHVMLGQWKEAAELFLRETTTNARNPQVWIPFVRLSLMKYGPAGYRSACEKMVKQFGGTINPTTATFTAWAWALAIGPEALPDMTLAVALARHVVEIVPTDANARTNLGAVLYRAGKPDEAVKELTAASKMSIKGGTWADHLFLAMAQHKLGKTDVAMKSLAAAEKLLDSDPAWFWTDKLERQLLRDEATKLIRGK